MHGAPLVVFGLFISVLSAAVAQSPLSETAVFAASAGLPTSRCNSSPTEAAAFPFADVVGALGGATWKHVKRTSACQDFISSAPKSPSAYLDCDNWRCQVLGNGAARGIIGGVERQMREKLGKTLGTSYFGLRTSLRYSTVDQGRNRIEGGHRLSVMFLNQELRLPIQHVAFERTCKLVLEGTVVAVANRVFTPPSLPAGSFETIARPATEAQPSCVTSPAHTILGLDWSDRYFHLGKAYIPIPPVGTAQGMYLSVTHSNSVNGFTQKDDRCEFQQFVHRVINPIDDDQDWSWLAPRPEDCPAPARRPGRMSESFTAVSLGSAWKIELETPGAGISAGVIGGELRGLISGNAGSYLTHAETPTVGTVDGRLKKTFSATNTLEVKGDLKAGLRLRIKAWRFAYIRDFTLALPSPSTNTSSPWIATEYDVAVPDTQVAYTFRACPPGVVPPTGPNFLTDNPPASNDEGPNLIPFATEVGKQVDRTYQFCADSMSSGKTWDPTRDPELLRLVNKWRAAWNPALTATACAEFRRYLDRMAFVCVRQGAVSLLPVTRMRVGISRCELLPA
jgi:hypothetical protein